MVYGPVIELADGTLLLSHGNAGPYASDDLERVVAGRMRKPLLESEEIEQQTIETVQLDARR